MSKYKIGDIVKGKVTGIENYGVFLLLDDEYTGLIHISEISEKFVRNIFDYVQLDEVINSKILEIDDVNKKMKLTIKNFDYRIEDKKEFEDKNGFSPLREKLPKWISEYNERTKIWLKIFVFCFGQRKKQGLNLVIISMVPKAGLEPARALTLAGF